MKINLNDNVGDLAVGMDLFATTFAVFFVIMSLGLISGNESEPNDDVPTQITFIVVDNQTPNLSYFMEIGDDKFSTSCGAVGCDPNERCRILSDKNTEQNYLEPWIIICDDLQPSSKSTLFNISEEVLAKAEISITKIFGNQVCNESVMWSDIVGNNGQGKEVNYENCD